jgi:hypothetical protein
MKHDGRAENLISLFEFLKAINEVENLHHDTLRSKGTFF